MKIVLPWPPSALSPNSRKHWSIKAKAAAKHKADCQYAAMAAGARQLHWPSMSVAITFCPPGNQRRDLDNMLAAMKSGLDGLAAATAVDDSKWSITLARGDWVKGGAVDVEISPSGA